MVKFDKNTPFQLQYVASFCNFTKFLLIASYEVSDLRFTFSTKILVLTADFYNLSVSYFNFLIKTKLEIYKGFDR